MALLRLLLPLLPLAATVAGTQWPLTGNLRRPEVYEGFTAVGALRNAVSGEGFTTFGHPLFPGYSARIRHLEHWCDEHCTFQTVSSGRLIVTRDLPIGSPVIGSPTYVMRDSEPIGPAIAHLCGYPRGLPAR